jgi:hypothetical protein
MSNSPDFPVGCGQNGSYPHLSTGTPSYPQPAQPERAIHTPNGRLDLLCTSDTPSPRTLRCDAPYRTPTGELVSCRKCAACMRIRSRRWQRRAQREFEQAPRTWWVTLTHRADPAPSYKDVQRWLKVIRKAHPSIRYLITEETGHASGRLHWHVLVHSSSGLQRRPMEQAWRFGYCHARLAKTAGLASYMAKYQAKAGKLRASSRYGTRPHYFHIPAPNSIPDSAKADDVLRTYNDYSASLLHMRRLQHDFAEECRKILDTAHRRRLATALIQAHKDAPLESRRTLLRLREAWLSEPALAMSGACPGQRGLTPGHDHERLDFTGNGLSSDQ